MTQQIETMTNALMDMAKSYGLGTPESRAIVTALEHARIVAGIIEPETKRIEIRSKVRHQRGQTYGGESSGMFAEITKDSIHLTGFYCGKVVDITFKVGDIVEYDSYNLRYLGKIEKITEKRITVQPRYGATRKSMDLYTFAWRNYKFDLEQANAENARTSYEI